MANFNKQVLGDIDLSSDVLLRLADLCMSAEHSDVMFVVENTKIPAHKMILSARCPYFQKLFGGGFAEATQAEIKLEVPLDAFKMVLRFIYTGQMSLMPLNVNQLIDVYGLVELYDLEALKETIQKYLAVILSVDNCIEILNAATLYSSDVLNQACLTFMDGRSTEFIKHETFKSISSTALCTLLKRDTFYAPEIEIFAAVKDWINHNPTSNSKAALSTVRWSLISMDEWMDIVVPSNVLNQSDLMDIVNKNRENKTYRIPCSSSKLSRENFACAKYNAATISGENVKALLDGNFTDYSLYQGFTNHIIYDGNLHDSIIVKLDKVRIINYIEMLLMDKDTRAYSYYIEVSVNGNQYERIIDFTACYGRSWQLLHFSSRPVQFIKLLGTNVINILTQKTCILQNGIWGGYFTFDVVGFKAIYVDGHDAANWKNPGVLRTTDNVATSKIGAIILEGGGGSGMLNQNMDEFTCHEKNQGQILLQLNQPYYISSMRMLLGCDGNNSNQYSFYIETSLDNKKWQMAVDKRDESLSGWQQFEFEERPVVFVKIIGTQPDINFVCTYFECPSNPRKPNLRPSQLTLASS